MTMITGFIQGWSRILSICLNNTVYSFSSYYVIFDTIYKKYKKRLNLIL